MTHRVVQVVQHLRPGGIETMALDLLENLADGESHLVSLEGDKATAIAAWPRLAQYQARLHFLDKPQGRSWWSLLRLALLLKRLKARAVHTHHIGPLLYGGLAARIAGIKCRIHTEHDAWHLESDEALALETKLLDWVKPTLVADCHMVARKVETLLPHYPVRVIPNGIDMARFRPVSSDKKGQLRREFGLPIPARLVGCAARLEPVKAIENLLIAMTQLPEHIHLALAGDGSERMLLQSLSSELGLAERVHFLGAIDQMPEFYGCLDLFCLPSLKEGLPLSPLEAQACDVPVVLTRVGGCPDISCPDTGKLVNAGDCLGLQLAIRSLLQRPSSRSPRQFVAKIGDLRTTVARYAELLEPDHQEARHA